jgi:Holliday junction resolvase RusA-like endonuclease
MSGVAFFVAGTPIPKARARVVRTAKGVRSYTPDKTANYETRVAWHCQQAMNGRDPLIVPVRLDLMIYVLPPASWSQRRQTKALAGEIAPTVKPDASNVCKAVEDAMNGVAYRDDSQIVELRVTKRYSDSPGVQIAVTPLFSEAAR